MKSRWTLPFNVRQTIRTLREHPEWFRKRADGSIAYAENPPKKYQDIYPFDFECDGWRGLWTELKSVFEFWIGQGVQIFRVDNPHTKSFAFWEWCLGGAQTPASAVDFPGRGLHAPGCHVPSGQDWFHAIVQLFSVAHIQVELDEYLTVLSQPPVSDFFRPNLWPNTPDILPEALADRRRAHV